MNKSIFDLPERMNNIQRFAGKHISHHRSSISEHSFEVSYYANLILNEMSSEVERSVLIEFKAYVLEYCLIHDAPEVFTGDIPYTAKAKFPELKDILNKVEDSVHDELLPSFNRPADDDTKFICKIADAIAVTREILNEVRSNNPHFTDGEIQNCVNIFQSNFEKYPPGETNLRSSITAAMFAVVGQDPMLLNIINQAYEAWLTGGV